MKLLSLTIFTLFTTLIPHVLIAKEGNIAMHGKETTQKIQIFYGKVLEIKSAMGYKYLKIDEKGKEIWVAIANAPVSIGDKIGFDKKTMMKEFQSKSLGQKFDEIYFASNVYLPEKTTKPKSMKALLGLNTTKQDPHAGIGRGLSPEPIEEIPSKPFVKKVSYSVEEIHMWRKNLKDQIITLEGTVFKVSHGIMKRDWVHIGDGSGNEKKLTDDLVFTATSTTIKSGDKVLAKGKVIVDKDFGYGYFYKVIIENATFEVK
jgi:predicted heme/steroid binding protein